MAVTLTLTCTAERHVLARLNGGDQSLCPATPLADLSPIEGESNPYMFNPFGLGRKLFRAIGGEALLTHLDDDADNLLLLVTDEGAAAIPWEYAALSDQAFLVWHYGFLRLLPQAKKARLARAGTLNLAVLGADPLVDDKGRPIPAHSRFNLQPDPAERAPRLDLETEIRQIRRTLANSHKQIEAQVIPPTQGHLRQALRRGPAVLHLSCHGTVIEQKTGDAVTPQAILFLEDVNGAMRPLRGDQLKRLPGPGVLRLIVMSACRSAAGRAGASDASLARAMVFAGAAPAAIGMQADFPDPLSATFAANLYDSLLLGETLGESLRQARLAMDAAPYAAGLPVAYVAPGGWQPLPVDDGVPRLEQMDTHRYASLPPLLTPPDPLVGREVELHQLAQTTAEHKVVTVVGGGGIGKTALSAAFASRFGWRWPGGVIGYSLAQQPTISPETVFISLLSRLLGRDLEPEQSGQAAEQLFETFLCEARQREPLILIDNYETVLQALTPAALDPDEAHRPPDAGQARQADREAAERLHRLLYKLAEANLNLLLTSRRQPSGFPGEVLFPRREAAGSALRGLSVPAGATLFVHHSGRAKQNLKAHENLAREVAQVTRGHPLAITLLAGEFDHSGAKSPTDFLENWDEELESARRAGVAPHHVTFATAFERSFGALTGAQQVQLAALSQFAAPFFAEGAALLWGRPLPENDDERSHLGAALDRFLRRSLLAVEGTYADGTPATYYLEPVIGRHLRRTVSPDSLPTLATAYARYADWLVGRCYGDIYSDVGLARLALQWLDELVLQVKEQPAETQGGYCWRLAWLLRHYGRLTEAGQLLDQGEAAARQADEKNIISGLLYEKAYILRVRGDLEGALQLYDESLAIQDQLGDLKGRSATLHAKAYILRVRGDLEGALQLYDESLAIQDQLGDLKGRSATLHAKAYILRVRGDLEGALQLYDESLAIQDQLGDLQGKGITLSVLANLHMDQNNWQDAQPLIEEALRIAQHLNMPSEIAFNTVKLGQVAQARGDKQTARQYYQEGLTIFKRLGMPEADQVRQMLADLENGPPPGASTALSEGDVLLALTRAAIGAAEGQGSASQVSQAIAQFLQQTGPSQAGQAYLARLAQVVAQPQPTTLVGLEATGLAYLEAEAAGPQPAAIAFALSLARLLDRHGYPAGATAVQNQAILRLRQDEGRQGQQALSVALYNQAGYLAQLERLDEAIAAMEDVVAIDERLGLGDLESDRATLQAFRRRQAGEPAPIPASETGQLLAALESQLAEMPPEQQAQARQFLTQMGQLSPEEQAALLQDMARQQFAAQADQALEAALAAHQAGQSAALIPELEAAAARFAQGEAPGSPYAHLAQFVRAVIALLRGQPPEPVAAEYAERLALLQQKLKQS